ncbi:hypothetical protein SOM12_18705, partial [Flavobacterium sp. CFBP9031]|uniref:beta strand repeat-containing protein n=1 Tax=Flavobacterium sp. CFBP9031 TaxID=3096538 RepID=UPI002A6C9ACE|nr:hypothetical protein [Flavobacterium sp. CFBP9031]
NIIQDIVNKTEGNVTFDSTTNQFSYVDASGNTQVIDISTIVKANETVTTLVNNGAGSYTYTNEAGTAVNIDIVGDVTTNFSTIVNNPAVTNIIQDIVNKTEGNVTFDSTTNQFSYVDASGNTQIIDISTIVKANETITTLDKDAANNGQYTYTSENATTTTIDIVGDVINNASTILNNSTFITQLTNIIKTNETLTSLTYDGVANTLTYIDEKSTPYTINLLDLVGDAETQTTLVYDQTAKTLTYNGESGTPTVINLVDLVGDAETVTTITPIVTTGNSIATYNNEAGTSIDIKETVTTQSQDPATGAITFTNETGTALTSNVISSDSANIITAGSDGGALLTPTAITNLTTVSNASAVNNLTTTVNGITSTGAPIINSNETALTGATLTTTVNGVASTALDLTPAITAGTTNALSLAGNTLTSNVNGVSTTSDAVSGVSNASAINTATVTVNGITSTGAPIINSNETALTGATLTTTVNGVASTALDLTPAITAGTTNTLSLAGNTLTSNVNGVSATSDAVSGVSNTSAVNDLTTTVNGVAGTAVPIINSNETSLTGAALTTTVNGVASTALDLTPAITAGTTNTLSLAGNTLTSNVNGVSTTSDAVSGVSNTSAVNDLTTTVNGVAGAAVPIINSNETSLTGAALTTTVNGIASTALDLTPAIKASETITTITPIVNSGSVIATYTNEAGGPSVDIQQTVTKQTQDIGTGIINFINEEGLSVDSHVISADPDNIITVGSDGGALLTPTTLTAATTNTLTATNGDLISTVNGVATTPAVPVLITADNGLTSTNGNVQLGGNLTLPTTISTDFANTLAITGLMHGNPMDEILVTDPGGGIIRTIKPFELNMNNWSINGNMGIQAQVNFLGTLDDADLVFRRNSVISGRIEVNNTSFGVNAFNNNPTGQFNAAFGTSSLLENTTGTNNTAIGYNSLTINATGSNNTAAGSDAGALNSSGSANTFIGNNANPTGSAVVNNATAIGNNSKVATDNSLVLGGIDVDAVNVGIGIDAPTNTLHVKPLTGINPVRFEGLQPSISGTDNIVVADATGILRTVTPSSLIPATTVSNSSALNSLSTTVNGVTGTSVNIINSNTTSLTGASLTTTVNGIASTPLDLTPAIKANETITTVNPIVTTGNIIATYINEAGGTPVEVKETVTTLSYNSTLNTLNYVGEGTSTAIDLVDLVNNTIVKSDITTTTPATVLVVTGTGASLAAATVDIVPSTIEGDVLTTTATGVEWKAPAKPNVLGIKITSGDYTLVDDDYTIIAKNLTSDITLTLPDATTNTGRILVFNQNTVSSGGTAVVVNFNVPVVYSDTASYPYIASSVFGGATGGSLKITLQSDGTNWYVINYTM